MAPSFRPVRDSVWGAQRYCLGWQGSTSRPPPDADSAFWLWIMGCECVQWGRNPRSGLYRIALPECQRFLGFRSHIDSRPRFQKQRNCGLCRLSHAVRKAVPHFQKQRNCGLCRLPHVVRKAVPCCQKQRNCGLWRLSMAMHSISTSHAGRQTGARVMTHGVPGNLSVNICRTTA